MGENYVLGNRKDDNEETPYELAKELFESQSVVDVQMDLGVVDSHWKSACRDPQRSPCHTAPHCA